MMAFIPPAGFLGFTCLVLVQKFALSSLSSVLRTYELDKWCVSLVQLSLFCVSD